MITARIVYKGDGVDRILDEKTLIDMLEAIVCTSVESVKILIESTSAKRITLHEYAEGYKAKYFNMSTRVAQPE